MNCIYRIFVCLSIVFPMLFLPAGTETWAASGANISHIGVNAQAVLESGVNQIQKGKYTEAIESFTQAIEIDPNLSQAYYHRCSAYLETSDYQQALADCNLAIEQNRNNFEAYLNRGLVYYRLGLLKAAITDFNYLLNFHPQDYRLYYDRALAHFDQKKYERAIADYDRTLQLMPQTNSRKLAEVYNNRGVAYLKQNVLGSAISDFSHAITLDRDDATFYCNRASVWRKQKQYQNAIADFSKSIEINPKQGAAYLGRGFTFYQVDEQESGQDDLFQAAAYFYIQGDTDKSHQILYFIEILDRHEHFSDALQAYHQLPLTFGHIV